MGSSPSSRLRFRTGRAAAAASLRDGMLAAASVEGIEPDQQQLEALGRLAELGAALAVSGNGSAGRPAAPLYLWGPPGRGKSWLMNVFHQAVPIDRKRRLHFHDFFRELHARTHAAGTGNSSMSSAFDQALTDLLGDCRLLCFDEFHVQDVGDAMFASRLLKEVFARGIALVCTSNYAPHQLLPNPLYHDIFLPTIGLIEQEMQLVPVDGPVDYRTLHHRIVPHPTGPARADAPADGARGFAAGSFLVPGTADQLAAVGLLAPEPAERTRLQPTTHALTALRAQGRQLWFTFADLCEQPSATQDYLALADAFDHWIISDVPPLDEAGPDGWQRFSNLVDVLYDEDRRLDLLSTAPLDIAQPGIAHPIDVARIASRLSLLAHRAEPVVPACREAER
jgi:cell division protein ZapE